MKKLLFLLLAIAILSAIGCGEPDDTGDDDTTSTSTSPPPTSPPTPEPTYPDVRGNYSCTVVETKNTCTCAGARGQLANPIPLLVEQEILGGIWPEGWAYLSASAGLYKTEDDNMDQTTFNIGGALSTSGNISRENLHGPGFTTLNYTGIFEITGGAVTGHKTTSPSFLEIDYVGSATDGDICCNGEDSQAILTLDCPRM